MTHLRSAITGMSFLMFVAATGAQEWDVGSDDWSSSATQPETATPPLPAAEAAPQDATYTIKSGDTLWDLAFQFLGDPFQWQRIWQINSYITNPDLIYPGNQLRIPGRSNDATTGGAVLTSETSVALDSSSDIKETLTDSPPYPGDAQLATSIRQKNILGRAFLTTVPFLWTERDAQGNIFPGNAIVNSPVSGKSWQLFSMMTFKPFGGAVYQPGDTVDIFKSLRFVRFGDKPMNLVRRTGRACVRKVQGTEVEALLFEMSDAIEGKERAAPAASFPRREIDTLVEPTAAISAQMFTRVEETESPYPFQMIILDKGSTQGIEVGDVFGIYHRDLKDSPARLNCIGIIGHIGVTSSTLMIVMMADNRISDGDRAILLRRARFSGQEHHVDEQ